MKIFQRREWLFWLGIFLCCLAPLLSVSVFSAPFFKDLQLIVAFAGGVLIILSGEFRLVLYIFTIAIAWLSLIDSYVSGISNPIGYFLGVLLGIAFASFFMTKGGRAHLMLRKKSMIALIILSCLPTLLFVPNSVWHIADPAINKIEEILLLRNAEKGNIDAQTSLGYRYVTGDGVAKNGEQALYWFIKAAEKGGAKQQTTLGMQYCSGDAITKDGEKALYWFTKAAEQDDLYANTLIANVYLTGECKNPDIEKGINMLVGLAENGDVIAQGALSNRYSAGKIIPPDYKKAYLWSSIAAAKKSIAYSAVRNNAAAKLTAMELEQVQSEASELMKKIEAGLTAKRKNADDQYYLGDMYQYGWGVAKNANQASYLYKNAASLYKTSAIRGNAEAQFELGEMYAKGQGVVQDDEQATDWYRKAAEQNDSYAQNALGNMYYRLDKHSEQAVAWYLASAGQGHPDAQYSLCLHAELSDQQAAAWCKKAAEHDHPYAQQRLGEIYLAGTGMPQNNKQAYVWLSVAIENGYPNHGAVTSRDSIATKLTPEALEEAKAEVEIAAKKINTQFDNVPYRIMREGEKFYIWYAVSAATGDTDSIKSRDINAAKLTPSELEHAQKIVERFVKIIEENNAAKQEP